MAKKLDNRNLNKEEDDANLQEVIGDADSETPIKEDVATETNTTDDPGNTEDTPDTKEDTPDTPDKPDEAPKPVPGEPAMPGFKDEPDYKEKFSASTRETMVQKFKNERMTTKIDEASNLPEPTLEELKAGARAKGAEYDELDPFAQGMLKDSIISSRRFNLIRDANDAGKKIDDWADSVDEFTNSAEMINKYPSLTENESEFKKYAMKESRRGMDKEELLASFLYRRQGDDPDPKPTEKKKDIFLTGGGGGDSAPKPTEITASEARGIRNNDPTRYKQLVKEGKIGMGVLDAE